VTAIVVDASAVLALLGREPGWEAVAEVLDGALISSVNFAEAIHVLTRRGLALADSTAALVGLPIVVVEFDRALAVAAGAMRTAQRRHDLSLGDCACLVLAQSRTGSAVTTDRTWSKLDLGIEVRLAR
jgi:PIN domain nuclease of toxin-antitoxin system